MRILITTTPGARNFAPVRTFADAFGRAGHRVMVAVERSGEAQVGAAGLDCWPLEPEARQDLRVAYEGILAAVEQWRPHLIVHETAEFTAVLVAERADLPVARIAVVSGTQERAVAAVAAPTLDALREELGLECDPTGARILSGRGLTLIPEVLEDPAAPVTLERFREPKPWPRGLPDWWRGDDRPLVHVALGPREMSVHRAALDQLAELPVRVLITVGPGQDAGELGALPAGAHANPGMALADVTPYTSVLVCEGSSSAIASGLTTGVPMVAVPLANGQALNATSMAATGAGLALEGGPAAVGSVGAAVGAVLRSDDYKRAAERVSADIAALPLVDDALANVLTSA